jgi:hypothetical protein
VGFSEPGVWVCYFGSSWDGFLVVGKRARLDEENRWPNRKLGETVSLTPSALFSSFSSLCYRLRVYIVSDILLSIHLQNAHLFLYAILPARPTTPSFPLLAMASPVSVPPDPLRPKSPGR